MTPELDGLRARIDAALDARLPRDSSIAQAVVEQGAELAGVGQSLLRAFLQRGQHHAVEIRAHSGAQLRRRRPQGSARRRAVARGRARGRRE